MLMISTDAGVLADIKRRYITDKFCKKLATNPDLPRVAQKDSLWYIGTRLVIPQVGDVRESLFRLAHDCLGHFGADKSYAALRDAYYWPNMQQDLELSYIPGCVDCQCNKSRTTKPAGLLHPLPVPDDHCTSIGLDFIGPLPLDEGFDCILTMTARLNSDL
jgi:hypothetical protein